MKVPEQYRLKTGALASDATYGPNGFFIIPHPYIPAIQLNCMASNGSGWDHVSVTVSRGTQQLPRCPTWEEMCIVKEFFWDKEEAVLQYHPAESDYRNCHPYCLHLWRPQHVSIPVPDPEMVGPKKI